MTKQRFPRGFGKAIKYSVHKCDHVMDCEQGCWNLCVIVCHGLNM